MKSVRPSARWTKTATAVAALKYSVKLQAAQTNGAPPAGGRGCLAPQRGQ
jgi:hypothetical protein